MSMYKTAAVHTRPESKPEVHHYIATGEPSVSLRFHGANVYTVHEQNGSRCEHRIEDVRGTVFLTPEQARVMAHDILAALPAESAVEVAA